MKSIIFREYDIRGIVDVDLFIEDTRTLARAIAVYLHHHNPNSTQVIVGMDVRTHSPALHAELCHGLQESGYSVINLGLCTSPMLYFATHTLPCAGGIMITASHNPAEYNGFKIVCGTKLLWGLAIQEIKKLYDASATTTHGNYGELITHDISFAYTDWLLEQFPLLHQMHLPVAFDCGNGATSIIMPHVVHAFKWSHATLLYAEPDGKFPHHPADPIDMHNMQDLWHTMQQKAISVGIGFDGDGDRMDAIDETGYLIPGDQLLALFTTAVAEKHPGCTIVCDITVSAAVLSAIKQAGGNPIIAPCGAGIIKEYMQQHNALVGGELSCHFFFADRGFGFDDGIYAALRLLEIIVKSEKSLGQLRKALPQIVSSPQYRIACREETKKEIVSFATTSFKQRSDVEVITIDGARIIFSHGWGLVRASNTQPMLVFRFESESDITLRALKKEFADLLSSPLELNLHTLFGI